MLRSAAVNVVDSEKFNTALTAAGARRLTTAVVAQYAILSA
jgi:hypothetical protein